MKAIKTFYFLFIICIIAKNALNELITVTATNEVKTICENNLYFIEIKAYFSSSFNNYYSFPLTLLSPYGLKLKCSFTYEIKSIFCFANLNSNKNDIEMGEFITLPQSFPKLENINWDYDSFVKNIYGKEWLETKNCLHTKFDNYFNDEWGFVFNITDINENKCSNSLNEINYKYNFQIKAHILDGKLKSKIEKMNNDNKNYEIEFLQDIWVPLLISLRKDKYKKVYDFPFAFCSLKEKISKSNINYLISDGLIFYCHIPIPEGKLLIGSIQILPFYDYLHLRINEEGENKREIVFENIYFNINRTVKESYNNSANNINYQLNNVKKDYKISKIEETNNSDINSIESYYNNNLTTDNILIKNDIKPINNEDTNNSDINTIESYYNNNLTTDSILKNNDIK